MGGNRRQWDAGDNDSYFKGRSCARKKRFDSRSAAMDNRRGMKESNLRPYFCKFCKGWHLGRRGDVHSSWYEKNNRNRYRNLRQGKGRFDRPEE